MKMSFALSEFLGAYVPAHGYSTHGAFLIPQCVITERHGDKGLVYVKKLPSNCCRSVSTQERLFCELYPRVDPDWTAIGSTKMSPLYIHRLFLWRKHGQ